VSDSGSSSDKGLGPVCVGFGPQLAAVRRTNANATLIDRRHNKHIDTSASCCKRLSLCLFLRQSVSLSVSPVSVFVSHDRIRRRLSFLGTSNLL